MTVSPQLPVVDFSRVGPPVGSRFPDVRLPDQTGRVVDLHAVRGDRRALVVIYRSARW
jgi:peroxiredoxin